MKAVIAFFCASFALSGCGRKVSQDVLKILPPVPLNDDDDSGEEEVISTDAVIISDGSHHARSEDAAGVGGVSKSSAVTEPESSESMDTPGDSEEADSEDADASEKPQKPVFIPDSERLNNPEHRSENIVENYEAHVKAEVGRKTMSTTALIVDLNVKLWVIQAGSKLSTSVTAAYESKIMLFKSAMKDSNQQLIREDGYLDVQEGVWYNAQCKFEASSTGVFAAGVYVGLGGSFDFGPVGVGGGFKLNQKIEIKKATTLSAYSNRIDVKAGDTVDSIQDKCENIFEEKFKEPAKSELKKLLDRRLYVDQRDGSELIINAALYGPVGEDIEANGETWDVERIRVGNRDQDLLFTGKLTRKKFLSNQDICYQLYYNQEKKLTGQVIDQCGSDLDPDEDWAKKAQELIYHIGEEAVLRVDEIKNL